MNLSVRAIDLDAIRLDGGTQVREALDEAWVEELAALYKDGHDIDPILVVVDADGGVWLVDGFHRVAAMRRLGWTGCKADVREGPVDLARMLAARANKNGLPRTSGDKKRAILLALSTPEGKRMGVRELARHCGVSVAHAQRIVVGEEVSPRGHSTPSATTVPLPANRKRAVAVLWARIDAALRANPDRFATDIATEIGCMEAVVRARRKALGLPPITTADAARRREYPTRDKAAAVLREHPEWSNRKVADESGATPKTVAMLRDAAGLPPSEARGRRPKREKEPVAEAVSPRAPSPEPLPSAPSRKNDPRDAAEVIQMRPRVTAIRQDAMRLVEQMSDADRAAFADELSQRWPETFGHQQTMEAMP